MLPESLKKIENKRKLCILTITFTILKMVFKLGHPTLSNFGLFPMFDSNIAIVFLT